VPVGGGPVRCFEIGGSVVLRVVGFQFDLHSVLLLWMLVIYYQNEDDQFDPDVVAYLSIKASEVWESRGNDVSSSFMGSANLWEQEVRSLTGRHRLVSSSTTGMAVTKCCHASLSADHEVFGQHESAASTAAFTHITFHSRCAIFFVDDGRLRGGSCDGINVR
jgi:hypothetical protein